jgi:hypothetical protein
MVIAKYTGQLSINGHGRVGSYTAAVKARRCRARKYWIIEEFEKCPFPGPNYHRERTDLGKFKTKKDANTALLELTKDQVRIVHNGDINSYVRVDIDPAANLKP